jgi:hypothetical protein
MLFQKFTAVCYKVRSCHFYKTGRSDFKIYNVHMAVIFHMHYNYWLFLRGGIVKRVLSTAAIFDLLCITI